MCYLDTNVSISSEWYTTLLYRWPGEDEKDERLTRGILGGARTTSALREDEVTIIALLGPGDGYDGRRTDQNTFRAHVQLFGHPF